MYQKLQLQNGMSLPSRERGLKYIDGGVDFGGHKVAPFTGAWIEMGLCQENRVWNLVAPFTGAWIEIAGRRVRHPA